MYCFTGRDNWVDNLAGLGERRDIERLVPRVVEGEFRAKKLDRGEWLEFLGDNVPASTRQGRHTPA